MGGKKTETYRLVGILPGDVAVFKHQKFFRGNPFLVPRAQCERRLKKLVDQGIPNDQTLAAVSCMRLREKDVHA